MGRLIEFKGVRKGGVPSVLSFLLVAPLIAAFSTDEMGGSEQWAVQLAPGSSIVALAERVGASEWKPVGSLPDTYVLVFEAALLTHSSSTGDLIDRGGRLAENPEVWWEEKQIGQIRLLRTIPENEPLFRDQWHLLNTGQRGGVPGVDVNVSGVWADGYMGAGIGVSVVDTGTQYHHSDLQANYVEGHDFWYDDEDASPTSTEENHGTAVAGIILAAANDLGVVGIAPEAGLYPMRLLREGNSIPDSDEAGALSWLPDAIYVSNNSWGPSDSDGVSIAETGDLVSAAFAKAETARGGLGTIYVWAAGNGRTWPTTGLYKGERADYDGYSSAMQTIAVAAIGQDGQVASYSEPGACVMIAAPSKGAAGVGILTTDRTGADGYSTGDITDTFSGTSAAAPIVSGVVALMLDANPDLGWRDVQHILARTAIRTDWDDSGWFENAAGFFLNDDYGFGRVNALGAIRLAERWINRPVATMATRTSSTRLTIADLSTASRSLVISGPITVEHVEVAVNLGHLQWNQLLITLVSPAGTRSVLSRPFDVQSSDLTSYTFTTVQMWGEQGEGTWKLEIEDTVSGTTGRLNSVTLRVHGTATSMAAPTLANSTVIVDSWPLKLDPADWVSAPIGERLELISVVPLEGGSVTEDDEGNWWFMPPVDALGEFPLCVCIASSQGEARSFLVSIERPWLATDGTRSASIKGWGTSAQLKRVPGWGSVSDDASGITYFPDPAFADFVGADRFSLGPVSRFAEVSVPVLFNQEWNIETNGRDANIVLGLESVALNQQFTVEGWMRPDSWGEADTGFGRFFDKGSFVIFINGSDHGFYNDESLIIFTVFSNGESAAFMTPANSIVLGEWVHVAVVFNYLSSPQVQVYLNGVYVSTSSPLNLESDNPVDLRPPAEGSLLESSLGDPAYVGDNAGGARGFRGAFREVRIWSGMRSEAQMVASVSGEEPDDSSSLLARLREPIPGVASSILDGTLGASATFTEVRWSPAISPWFALRRAFPTSIDVGGGWSEVPRLDYLYGDFFPWVYLVDLGWVWVVPREEGPSFWFYRLDGELGWLYWTDETLSWMYSASRDSWLFYLPDTQWFYIATTGEWEEIK